MAHPIGQYTPHSLNYSSLDFDTYKQSLIEYLREQDTFRDYDFTGSNLNVLIDILAYNTFNNAFYTHMVGQEMWLTTAQLRDSIISHAKELGYLPRSSRSAKATANLTFNTGGPASFIIPKYSEFMGRAGADNILFTTNTAITVTTTSNTAVATAELYEGEVSTDTFVFRPGGHHHHHWPDDSRMLLSSDSVDVSSLEVSVIENSGSEVTEFQQVSSLFDLNSASAVFFVQAAEGGRYEIMFGDGVVGRRPAAGSVVMATYRSTVGAAGNGVQGLISAGPIAGFPAAVILQAKSHSGAYAESAESIRFNAPRHFSTQERAVTAADYETLLLQQFPEIISVAVYGGEEVDPPQYGKVFVTANIQNVIGLPDSKRAEYRTFLKQRTPLTIDPVFVLPEYLFVVVRSLVRYNLNKTAADTDFIRSVVINNINVFSDDVLNDFKSALRYSQLVNQIDRADRSIISNETDLEVYKQQAFIPGVQQYIDFAFDLQLEAKSIYSSPFVYNGVAVILRDDGLGHIQIVRDVSGQVELVVDRIGTVDYTTGHIQLVNIRPGTAPGNLLRLFATPASKDINSSKNIILTIQPEDIEIVARGIRE